MAETISKFAIRILFFTLLGLQVLTFMFWAPLDAVVPIILLGIEEVSNQLKCPSRGSQGSPEPFLSAVYPHSLPVSSFNQQCC